MIKNMIATFNSILLIIAIALILVHYFLDKPENNRDIAILEKVSKDQFINDMKVTFGTKYDYQQLSDYYDLLKPSYQGLQRALPVMILKVQFHLN